MAEQSDLPEKKAKAKKPSQRRSYSSELANLQAAHADLRSRVNMAVRLLKKITDPPQIEEPAAALALMRTAIETLEE